VESFKNIEYVDPNANYDGFCDMNKHMVIRKANSQFFVNLALNGFIPKSNVLQILVEMLNIVADLIDKPNKSDEVNELTENIAILFNKEIWYGSTEIIGGLSLIDFVRKIATSKSKDYKSLPSRVIFKYMDLLEM
jgi:cyclophilin family peptidyl-prolyl cis-trans isomerase